GLAARANPVNLGFLRSCNGAASEAAGEHLVLLNNDTVVGEGWLEALLAPVRDDPSVAMVGARLLNADGSLQEAGVIMYRDGWGVPSGRGGLPGHLRALRRHPAPAPRGGHGGRGHGDPGARRGPRGVARGARPARRPGAPRAAPHRRALAALHPPPLPGRPRGLLHPRP